MMLMRFARVRCCITMICLSASIFCMGASPKQESVPPQPFYADFYSGQLTVTEKWPSEGIRIYACVLDCDRFKTTESEINVNSGKYSDLKIAPTDRKLLYQEVTFYISNGIGSVKANETSLMEGAFIRKEVNLTFAAPPPMEIQEPTLPAVAEAFKNEDVGESNQVVVGMPYVGGSYNLYLIGSIGVAGALLIIIGVWVRYRVTSI